LEQAAVFRGFLQAIRTDGCPEFTSRVFMGWMHTNGIEHLLIQPGKSTQNAYIESFNGKFRDECLNEYWFETLSQARVAINKWRKDYNEVRSQVVLDVFHLLSMRKDLGKQHDF
jgi:putative transposase